MNYRILMCVMRRSVNQKWYRQYAIHYEMIRTSGVHPLDARREYTEPSSHSSRRNKSSGCGGFVGKVNVLWNPAQILGREIASVCSLAIIYGHNRTVLFLR